MQTLPLYSKRAPVAGAFCIALVTLLSGCASKNPLMEEPSPIASKRINKPAPQAPQTAAAAPEAPVVASASIAAAEPSAPAAGVAAAEPAPPAEPVKEPIVAEASKAESPAAIAAPAKAAPTGVQVKQEKRFLGFFRPYRPDIQQGNFISQEMVAQLKEGMTQDQVIFLLGTPLLTDMFHADRWDYPFRMQKGNGETTTSRVTVYFQNGRVSSFDGGDLPTEADYLARIADKAKQAKKK